MHNLTFVDGLLAVLLIASIRILFAAVRGIK